MEFVEQEKLKQKPPDQPGVIRLFVVAVLERLELGKY